MSDLFLYPKLKLNRENLNFWFKFLNSWFILYGCLLIYNSYIKNAGGVLWERKNLVMNCL